MAGTAPLANGSVDRKPQATEPLEDQKDLGSKQTKPNPKPRRPKKPDYGRIHSKPLPLEVYPIPALIPQNPLSLLRIAYIILKDYLSPRSSKLSETCIGYFSTTTRSVHITDPKHIRALWEMGFFGKGTLSRSEPSWLEREKARLREGKGGTSEEATRARREERRLFKLERARLEREAVELQRAKERGDIADDVLNDTPDIEETAAQVHAEVEITEHRQPGKSRLNHVFPWMIEEQQKAEPTTPTPAMAPTQLQHVFPWMTQEETTADIEVVDDHIVEPEKIVPQLSEVSMDSVEKSANGHAVEPTPATEAIEPQKEPKGMNGHASEITISVREPSKPVQQTEQMEEQAPDLSTNQEHLQLCLEEAFFLSYGLGALNIQPTPNSQDTSSSSSWSNSQLLGLFATHAVFPPCAASDIQPDNSFLLNYVVYHHYRSLGWVVRPGSKFSCDFLLYNRGPVFSHAEFALLIVPEYAQGVEGKRKDWWWLHCVNRVQSQVRKTLVLCYVEVPKVLEGHAEGDIGRVLKSYKIREFVMKRWLANRSRD